MTSIEEPQCFKRRCKHYLPTIPEGADPDDGIVYCKAFPKGIPDKIAYGRNLHLKPVQGDHGIQYEEWDLDVPYLSVDLNDVD